jgi:hypothetical protein
MASDNYSVQAVLSFLTGTATDRTETVTADDTCTQTIWFEVTVAESASDTNVKLGGLDDPKILIVYGGAGISFKLDSTGTDAIGAEPIAIVANETLGLGIDEILISNTGSEQVVGIFAAQ